MWYSVFIISGFAGFVLLVILPSLQQLGFRLLYHFLQLLVIVGTAGFAVASINPESVPGFLASWLHLNGIATNAELTSSGFWLVHGLWFAGVGLGLLMLVRHLVEIPLVNRHLKDITFLVGNVSRQVSNTEPSSQGQGALRRAVETMHSFFRNR